LGKRYCISVPPWPDSRWGNGVPPTKYLEERRSPAFPLHYTTGDIGGWLDTDMKINFHVVTLIRRLLLLACLKHSYGLSRIKCYWKLPILCITT